MDVPDTAVTVHQVLSPPAQFFIKATVQGKRIGTYNRAYFTEITEVTEYSLFIHRPFKGGIVSVCSVHGKDVFCKGQHFLHEKQTGRRDKGGNDRRIYVFYLFDVFFITCGCILQLMVARRRIYFWIILPGSHIIADMVIADHKS